MKPLAIDLYAGLGGWTDGLLAEGYFVVGFDIERHAYGEHRYPAQLVLQDVLTLHGSQFKDAALIMASPPCQEFSYMAMPWSKAKQMEVEYKTGVRDRAKLTALFDACFRIQREASEAAGHHIPLIVENVRGAQKWVGRSRWNFGSYHLWGDVPALMPMTKALKLKTTGPVTQEQADKHNCHINEMRDVFKVPGFRFDGSGKSFQTASVEVQKGIPHAPSGHWTNPIEGTKQRKSGRAWFADPDSISGSTSSRSNARKAASAMIARIPLPLAQYIARVWKPT